MAQFLAGILSGMVDPAALLLIVLVLTSGLCVRYKNWVGAGILMGLAIVMEVTLGTHLPHRLIGVLEAPYAPNRQPLPARADVIVMLGGSHDFSPNDVFQLGITATSDRIITAIELLRQGRAGTLILCSAESEIPGQARDDAALIERLMIQWNLRKGQVVRLPIVRNTADEARKVAALASQNRWKQILLVTSAFHLRRAEAAFRKAGIDQIIPVGCDFRGEASAGFGTDTIGFPSTESALVLKMWLHEQIGWWYYGIRGWR